jgi:hypothetical protein
MGMLVLLVEDAEVTISATTSERLARIGVSRVELFRGARTTAIALEGWAFDPIAHRTIAEVVAPGVEARALLPVMRVAVGNPAGEDPISA